MSSRRLSSRYITLLTRGPFPDQLDPWAEAGRYFQQIHAELISSLIAQIKTPLLELGYIAGREASLQIAERREPDIHVRRQQAVPGAAFPRLDYALASAEVLAEPGIVLESERPDLEALAIKTTPGGQLVTLVEIISPRNKSIQQEIEDYRDRRLKVLFQGINIVEIDLTRSVKRMLGDRLAAHWRYHIAVYLPEQPPRLIGMEYGQRLKRFALPLRGEVIPVELHPAYVQAYQQVSIAGQIADDGHYSEEYLPFPTLLSEAERSAALAAVAAWGSELARLHQNSTGETA